MLYSMVLLTVIELDIDALNLYTDHRIKNDLSAGGARSNETREAHRQITGSASGSAGGGASTWPSRDHSSPPTVCARSAGRWPRPGRAEQRRRRRRSPAPADRLPA